MKLASVIFLLLCTAGAASADDLRVHYTETGIASWYGWDHAGRETASGEIFHPTLMTAASWRWFGWKVRVHNLANGREVVVRVNDRGPAKRLGRAIDLSLAAFAHVADPRLGLLEVRITPIARLENVARR